MAECVGDGALEGWAQFRHVGCAAGRDETLLAPDFAPDFAPGFAPGFASDGGEGVGEGVGQATERHAGWANPSYEAGSDSWLFGSIAGLSDLLKRGYIVTATDYQGLGGPGPHPYLVGPSAAHSVLDAVRAARAIPDASASSRFAVWGESQGGHAALWTAQLAASYAPELQLVAAAAAAPPVDLAANLTGNTNAVVRALSTAYAAASWSSVYDVPLSTIARPVGQDLIRRLAKNCVTLDGFKLQTKIGLARLTYQLRGVNLNASPRWAELMRVNSVAPRKLGVPLLIAQGSADVIVAPPVTRQFVEQLCRAGQPLRFVEIAGGDHVTIAKRTAATTIDWIGDRFAGKAAPDDCSRLRPDP